VRKGKEYGFGNKRKSYIICNVLKYVFIQKNLISLSFGNLFTSSQVTQQHIFVIVEKSV